MAKNFQLSEFRTEVRRRGEYRAPYITDAELDSYINASVSHLYDLLIEVDPSRYLTQGTISVVSGTESYNLPADFYRAISVNIPVSSSPTGFILGRRINWQERHYYYNNVTSTKQNTFYAIRGGQIWFWPPPTWTDSVQLDYVPVYTTLSMDTDTFDAVNGYEEWVIADVLAKCAAKASDDAGPWLSQRDQMENRIKAGGDIDRARPKTVSNIWYWSGRRGINRGRLID